MGLNKERNLILCCREDHCSDSPRFDAKVAKIHFDLQSHGILWWADDYLPKFADDLRAKLTRRKELLTRPSSGSGWPGPGWIRDSGHRNRAQREDEAYRGARGKGGCRMDKAQLDGYMEFTSALSAYQLSADLARLLQAMQSTQIHTFGWPIGVVVPNDEYRPKPNDDGILAGDQPARRPTGSASPRIRLLGAPEGRHVPPVEFPVRGPPEPRTAG